MAKHKAPTSITIASTTDRTALHAFVEENWKAAALLAVVLTAVILGKQYLSQQSASTAVEGWDRLRQDVPFSVAFGPDDQMRRRFPPPDEVAFPASARAATIADELQDGPAGPWAKAIEAGSLLREKNTGGAVAVLQELASEWGDHPLAASPFPFDADGSPQTLADFTQSRSQQIVDWEAAHPLLFANPALPEGAPRVRLETSEGSIVVGLYQDEAPLHVANFLKLCGEGFYDGTKFHRVLPGRLIQGGDPNTREEERDTWGQGGPDYKVPREANGLRHFAHVLAMAKMGGDSESSGSQFYITAVPQHEFDERYVVFGTVLEGASVVTSMAATQVTNGDQPVAPAALLSTEVLSQ